ncbi:hypothetical protein [Amycolatopsis plumensis]|uniref:DUF3558 domain-containing protein n=1 Tax=Amycolatopsis plumensis TaxID=236508 RepID=A0ABV5U1G6_9PSEU
MAIGVVVVIGVVVGAFVLLNRGSSYDAVDGKYGAAPLATCDDVAARAGNLPPRRSDTPLEGSKGWLCTFTDPAGAATVHLDVEVTNTQRQRGRFDTQTASAGYVVDPATHLGERAAWGPVASGRSCDLMVLDGNATFKAGIEDWNQTTDDAHTCKDRVKAIAQVLYDVMKPR